MTTPTHQAVDSMSHPSGSSPHTEFPQFNHFPVEIRLEIWRHAMKEYRDIDVDVPLLFWYGPWKEDDGLQYKAHYPDTRLYSSLLSVNREARLEALRFYRCHMRSRPGYSRAGKPVDAVIYLNPEYDIFYFLNPKQFSIKLFRRDMKACDPRNDGALESSAIDTPINLGYHDEYDMFYDDYPDEYSN